MGANIIVTRRTCRDLGINAPPGLPRASRARTRVLASIRRQGQRPVRPELRSTEDPESFKIWRVLMEGVGTFVWVVFSTLLALAAVPSLFGYRTVMVDSGSMEPTLREGDVVVTADPGRDALATDTIVVYDDGYRDVIHRIVEVSDGGYRTMGDANPTPDPNLVAPEDVRGVAWLLIPLVGLPAKWWSEGDFVSLALLACAMALAVVLARPDLVRLQRGFGHG